MDRDDHHRDRPRSRRLRGDTRGQAFTLEGVLAGLLVLLALLLAFQAIVLTPTTAGTVDAQLKQQLGRQAADLLRAAEANGSLRRSVLAYNNSSGTFYDPTPADGDPFPRPDVGYGPETPPGVLGGMLNNTLDRRGYAYEVLVTYRTSPDDPGETDRIAYADEGVPTGNAATAQVSFVLYDDMVVTLPGDDRTLAELRDAPDSAFYAPDIDPDGPLYNVVTVTVVVW